MEYTVKRTLHPAASEADWDNPVWQAAETAVVAYDFGKTFEHRPDTRVRLLYDDNFIYGRFRVDDRHIRAEIRHDQEQVCTDSCVECFLRPAGCERYFNFEFNCLGVLLLYHIRHCRSGNFVKVAPDDLAAVRRHPTLKPFEGELPGPLVWQLGFAIPVALFTRYDKVNPQLAGQVWSGNFSKCADNSSHPHWLSWQPYSRLDFHSPEEFGVIRFEA